MMSCLTMFLFCRIVNNSYSSSDLQLERETRLEETSYAVRSSAFAVSLQQVFSPKENTIPSLCHKPQNNSNLLVLKRHIHTHTQTQNQNPKPLKKVITHHRKTAEGTWSQSITHCWEPHGQGSVVREQAQLISAHCKCNSSQAVDVLSLMILLNRLHK